MSSTSNPLPSGAGPVPAFRYADGHVIPSGDETAFASLGRPLDDQAHSTADQFFAADAGL